MIGIAHPIGGQLGGLKPRQKDRNCASQFLFAARWTQPLQHAYVRGGVSAISSSNSTQSASLEQLSSRAGKRLAVDGEGVAVVASGVGVVVSEGAARAETAGVTGGSPLGAAALGVAGSHAATKGKTRPKTSRMRAAYVTLKN